MTNRFWLTYWFECKRLKTIRVPIMIPLRTIKSLRNRFNKLILPSFFLRSSYWSICLRILDMFAFVKENNSDGAWMSAAAAGGWALQLPVGGRAPQLPVSSTLNLARPFQPAPAPGCHRLNPELKMAESLTMILMLGRRSWLLIAELPKDDLLQESTYRASQA